MKGVKCKKGEIRIEISKDLVKSDVIALGEWLRITILTQLIYSGSHYGANSLNCQNLMNPWVQLLISGTPTN